MEDPPQITVEDEFIPIGARGKVHWNFAITAASTDAEINAQGPGSLTNAVIQVDKILNITIQYVVSPMGPRELAKKARDILTREADKPAASQSKTANFMIPNPIFKIDPTTQQTPGVTVTPEEQNLANSEVLEYTFQIDLNVKNTTEILAFSTIHEPSD